jgi:hypothetical protein
VQRQVRASQRRAQPVQQRVRVRVPLLERVQA